MRSWIWNVFWTTQTPFLLSLMLMYDEVWLPFLLSMVMFMVMVFYLLDDTGQGRPSYVPKRHRKWARYRAKIVLHIWSTSFIQWIVKQSRKIENSILSSKTTRCHRGQNRGRKHTVSYQLTMRVRNTTCFISKSPPYRAMKKAIKTSYRATRKVVSILVHKDHDSPGMDDIMKRSVLPLILS